MANPFRALSRTAWLAIGLLALTLLLLLVGGSMLSERRRLAADADRARGGQIVAEGGQAATRDALKINDSAAAAARESEALTRRNDDEIRNAPGADAPAGGVTDAGLRSLCRRAAYHDHPRCAGLR